MYARLSSYELYQNGFTTQTDASDTHPETWMLRGKLFSWHRVRSLRWWAALILISMTVLNPLEILLEAGIDESSKCGPSLIRDNVGVCASPVTLKGRDTETYAVMSQVLNMRWIDQNWDYVPVGASLKPNSSEARRGQLLLKKKEGQMLVKDCKIRNFSCSIDKNCGVITTVRTNGHFRVVASNWSHIRGNKPSFGDLTYDGSLSTVFIFYGAGHTHVHNRSRIRVKGVEMILTKSERENAGGTSGTVYNASLAGSFLDVVANRSRLYDIECITDGLTESDLARAISLYRTSMMEQPGVQRVDIQTQISHWLPLSRSDVAKAAYSVKAIRWSDKCKGDIAVYVSCGAFDLIFMIPFLIACLLITLIWFSTELSLRHVHINAPFDARTWRKKVCSLSAVRRFANLPSHECVQDPSWYSINIDELIPPDATQDASKNVD